MQIYVGLSHIGFISLLWYRSILSKVPPHQVAEGATKIWQCSSNTKSLEEREEEDVEGTTTFYTFPYTWAMEVRPKQTGTITSLTRVGVSDGSVVACCDFSE
jgi:hypothetical protein